LAFPLTITNPLLCRAFSGLYIFNARLSPEECYDLGGSLLFMKGVNKSIGTGRNVVVLCSLEISRMVWRKRSCSAIGSLLIIAAAAPFFPQLGIHPRR